MPRPAISGEKIKERFLNYDITIDVNTYTKSSEPVTFTCKNKHTTTSMAPHSLKALSDRIDKDKNWIDSEHKLAELPRLAICTICNDELQTDFKNKKDREYVEKWGYTFIRQYTHNTKGTVVDVICKKTIHICIAAVKYRMEHYICEECEKEDTANLTELPCTKCKKTKSLDKFNMAPKNTLRKGHSCICIECNALQRIARIINGYKNPSKPMILSQDSIKGKYCAKDLPDNIEGKNCSTKDCGWYPYIDYYTDNCNADTYSTHCKTCKNKFNDRWIILNREISNIIKKAYKLKNPEKIKAAAKLYRETHREEIAAYMRARLANDPQYKVTMALRHRIYMTTKGTKSATTEKLLGCTYEEFMTYLGDLLIIVNKNKRDNQEILTWENQGSVWHIDHILPCASFNLLNPVHQSICFNYRNLQPMHKEDNIAKSDTYSKEDYNKFVDKMLIILEINEDEFNDELGEIEESTEEFEEILKDNDFIEDNLEEIIEYIEEEE